MLFNLKIKKKKKDWGVFCALLRIVCTDSLLPSSQLNRNGSVHKSGIKLIFRDWKQQKSFHFSFLLKNKPEDKHIEKHCKVGQHKTSSASSNDAQHSRRVITAQRSLINISDAVVHPQLTSMSSLDSTDAI